MSSRFLEQLSRRVLVFDGAMGSTLQSADLSVEGDYLGRENCVDLLVRSRPELVQEIHESFLAVGADAVETDTFGANKLVFAEFDDELVSWTRRAQQGGGRDRPRRVREVTTPGAASLRRRLDRPRHEAHLARPDDLGRHARELPGAGARTASTAASTLSSSRRARTSCRSSARSTRASTRWRSGRSPRRDADLLVDVTIETTGTMLLGTEIAAAVNALSMYPDRQPRAELRDRPDRDGRAPGVALAALARAIAVMPNAGLPGAGRWQDGLPAAAAAVRRGADALRRRVRGQHRRRLLRHDARAHRLARRGRQRPSASAAHGRAAGTGCSSLYSYVEFEQDNSFLIVAERTNANGSRKFKRLLDEEDWDGLVSMAREEMRDGAHVLDVCVDFVGRDGVRDMTEVVSRFVRQVNAPLMIDSTEAPVIEAALAAGGRQVHRQLHQPGGR